MGSDACVFGGSNLLDHLHRFAGDAGRIRKAIVGADDQDAVLLVEFAADFDNFVGASETLGGIDNDQIRLDKAAFDVLEHPLKGRSTTDASS